MELIFKVITTPTGGENERLKHTNFEAHYPSAHTNMAWKTINPYVRQAIKKYILPYIGSELYDDLATKYQNDTVLTAEQAETLELLQDCAAFYTVYQAMPHRNIVLADTGVQQNTPENASPTNQWSFKIARWNALVEADNMLDQLLSYLEQQIEASVAYFDLFKNSTAYNVKVSNFFRHTSELDEYLNINNSRRAFVALSKYLTKAEEQYLLPILRADQFNEIRDQMKANTLTTENTNLLAYVKKVVAEFSLVEAIPHLSLLIEGDGFKIVSSSDQFDNKRNLTNKNHMDAIQKLEYKAKENARIYRADLIRFLYDNVDDYPTWKAGGYYVEPTEVGGVTQSEDSIGAVGIF